MKSLLIAGALCAPIAVFAADEAVELDPVTTTATGTERPASRVLASQTVITREEIEAAQALDLADLLQFYAGLEIERSGGIGQLTQLRIRGGEADHTLILVDGIRLNPATGGPTLQNLALDAVERIEIVKGPRSTLYGSDAMTGTINIITRKSGGFGLEASGGRYGTREGSIHAGGTSGSGHVSASIATLDSDGLPVCAGSSLASPYRRHSATVNAGVQLGGTALGLRALDSRGVADYVDFCGPGGNNPLDQDFRQQSLAVDASLSGERWRSTLTASRVLDDLQQNQGSDYITTTRPQLEWSHVFELGEAHRTTAAFSYAREKSDVLSFGSGIRETRRIKSMRLQDEWSGGAHHALLAAAYTDHDAFGERGTWNAEYGFDASAALRLVATAGSGFRAPNSFERLGGFGGNPDLKPEFARNYELGAAYRFAPGHSWDLRAFHTETRDLIAFIGGSNVNVPEFRNQGAELGYRYVDAQWTAVITALVQDPENRTAGTQLLRRAKRAASLRLQRRFGAHFAALDVLGSAEKQDADFSSFPSTAVVLPGYALVNLSAGFELLPGLRLQARLENALDKDYQTAFGYNQAGAAATVGLRYQL